MRGGASGIAWARSTAASGAAQISQSALSSWRPRAYRQHFMSDQAGEGNTYAPRGATQNRRDALDTASSGAGQRSLRRTKADSPSMCRPPARRCALIAMRGRRRYGIGVRAAGPPGLADVTTRRATDWHSREVFLYEPEDSGPQGAGAGAGCGGTVAPWRPSSPTRRSMASTPTHSPCSGARC